MSGATTPRITPGGRRTIGPVAWLVAQGAGRAAGTAPPNLFLTLGRHRRVFLGWLHFASTLMPRGTLPRRETELVILRVAHVRRCAYEFGHHVALGRRAGITGDDVDRLVEGPAARGWSDRERVLLTTVDELLAEHDLRDDTWAALRRHLKEKQTIELLMLVGHYDMLATTLNTLRIQPDAHR